MGNDPELPPGSSGSTESLGNARGEHTTGSADPIDVFQPMGFSKESLGQSAGDLVYVDPTGGADETTVRTGVRLVYERPVGDEIERFEFMFPDSLGEGRYRIVDGTGSEPDLDSSSGEGSPPMPTARALGGGTFGVVARTRDRRGPDRAVKFLLQHGSGFLHEVEMTTRVPFKHVVPIIDHGETVIGLVGQRTFNARFLVSPLIDGWTLHQYFAGLIAKPHLVINRPDLKRRLHDQVLSLIDDLVAGLEEMSRADVVHMDIKPSNILVYPQLGDDVSVRVDGNPAGVPSSKALPRLKLFIIDLGAARHLERVPDSRIPIVATPYYFPTHWEALGVSRVPDTGGLTALGSEIRALAGAIDVYSAGRVLEEVFLDRMKRKTLGHDQLRVSAGAEERKEQFWREIFSDDFPLIEGLIARMLQGRQPKPVLPSDIRTYLPTIAPYNSRSVLASGPLVDPHPARRIRVGRALVSVSSPFDLCVDHSRLQRLRRINQLSMLSVVFPDATHSRFAHSLRTFHLAKRFVTALYRKSQFRLLFERAEVNHLLAAALLHDIGQYPFSHAIEDLRKIAEYRETLGARFALQWLKEVKYDQERVREMMHWDRDERPSVARILHDYGMDPEVVFQLTQKGSKPSGAPPTLHIGRDLIAGLIDVDRVSYLVHDSERTGVPYGLGVDVASLAEALTVRWESEDRSEWGLGIEEAGVSAVEALLTATYWMYRNVYWHHTNRGVMAAVKFVVRRLLERKAVEAASHTALAFDEYLQLTDQMSEYGALQLLNARWERAIEAIRLEGGREATNPLSSMMSGRRLGYRRVVSLRWTPDTRWLFVGMAKRITPTREDNLLRGVADRLPGRHARDGDILIDYPMKKRFQQMDDRRATTPDDASREDYPPLWVQRRRKISKLTSGWLHVQEESPLIKRLGATEDQMSRRIRVYFSRELLQQAEVTAFLQQEGENEIEKVISAHVESWRVEDERLH